MLITVFGPPTIMPSPLQLRFAVRFTTPLTTCPHAAFDDDDDAAAGAAPGVPPCCAAACWEIYCNDAQSQEGNHPRRHEHG